MINYLFSISLGHVWVYVPEKKTKMLNVINNFSVYPIGYLYIPSNHCHWHMKLDNSHNWIFYHGLISIGVTAIDLLYWTLCDKRHTAPFSSKKKNNWMKNQTSVFEYSHYYYVSWLYLPPYVFVDGDTGSFGFWIRDYIFCMSVFSQGFSMNHIKKIP